MIVDSRAGNWKYTPRNRILNLQPTAIEMSTTKPRVLSRPPADTSGSFDLSPNILINPTLHRTLIFSAVKESHPEECSNRYVHYDPHHRMSPRPIETTKPFRKISYMNEISVNVSEQGQRYLVEGTILDIRTGEIIHIQGYIKTIPKGWYTT